MKARFARGLLGGQAVAILEQFRRDDRGAPGDPTCSGGVPHPVDRDSSSHTNAQQRFKSTHAPIRLFQI
jgi:hypothetical protein